MPQASSVEVEELRQETYSERAWRLTRENPLVPIGMSFRLFCFKLLTQEGTLATCAAFVMATVRWGQGNSRSLNLWLRGRVVAHLFTIGAAAYTMYALGQFDDKKIHERAAELQQLKAQHDAKRERAGFEQRLKQAEENYEAEMKAVLKSQPTSNPNTGSSWWSVLGWTRK